MNTSVAEAPMSSRAVAAPPPLRAAMMLTALAALSASMLYASPPERAPEGALKSKVVAALKAVAGGQCPEELMNPLLLEQCEQQLPRMQERLSGLGPIKDAQYRGIESLPNGTEAEVYKIIFTKGTMLWLAASAPNGKLSALWSPG